MRIKSKLVDGGFINLEGEAIGPFRPPVTEYSFELDDSVDFGMIHITGGSKLLVVAACGNSRVGAVSADDLREAAEVLRRSADAFEREAKKRKSLRSRA